MNSSIDVGVTVANGTSLHNTDEGGVPFSEGGAETLRVVGVDTGLVAVGPSGKTLNLWDYQDQRYARRVQSLQQPVDHELHLLVPVAERDGDRGRQHHHVPLVCGG